MLTCSSCGAHKRQGPCPSCGRDATPNAPSAAFVLLGLALAGCSTSQALYGTVDTGAIGDTSTTDGDGDGFVADSAGGDDCDDTDETVNPDADETPGDGVDSNCDGEDDT